MTADLLGPQKRASGFGIQRVVINSTYALGPLAGGFIGPRIGYLPLFAMDALTSYFIVGFYELQLHTGERLNDNQGISVSGGQGGT